MSLSSTDPDGIRRPVCQSKGKIMSKGNNQRGNKEAKKPKQAKTKAPATANAGASKPGIVVAGKQVK